MNTDTIEGNAGRAGVMDSGFARFRSRPGMAPP